MIVTGRPNTVAVRLSAVVLVTASLAGCGSGGSPERPGPSGTRAETRGSSTAPSTTASSAGYATGNGAAIFVHWSDGTNASYTIPGTDGLEDGTMITTPPGVEPAAVYYEPIASTMCCDNGDPVLASVDANRRRHLVPVGGNIDSVRIAPAGTPVAGDAFVTLREGGAVAVHDTTVRRIASGHVQPFAFAPRGVTGAGTAYACDDQGLLVVPPTGDDSHIDVPGCAGVVVAILGLPVGFIGAAESKAALADTDLEHLVVHGRRGGSAMAVAAVNAIASDVE